ncbi:hypothetical protein J6590_034474 [Homalodisca vitripennis]|nr:hypothetical protein J6590_034474 [Homalodisca vitripennis]
MITQLSSTRMPRLLSPDIYAVSWATAGLSARSLIEVTSTAASTVTAPPGHLVITLKIHAIKWTPTNCDRPSPALIVCILTDYKKLGWAWPVAVGTVLKKPYSTVF